MTVAVEQRHVPLHVHAKAGIAIGANRVIAKKEDRQFDSRPRREVTEQRRLVLDRMTDQACNAVAALHPQATCGFESGLRARTRDAAAITSSTPIALMHLLSYGQASRKQVWHSTSFMST